jgi:Na+-transporting methylmalonyl-CoA/oxaloacetate decarboxylase beta subunit
MDGTALKLWESMGIANLTWGQVLMMAVGCGLIYLAIAKKFEPLLLVPIGFGACSATSRWPASAATTA